METIRGECEAFAKYNARDLIAGGWDGADAGHDFYLTRNGHGTGFWDRGKGEHGERLSNAAKGYNTSELYPSADGKLHIGG